MKKHSIEQILTAFLLGVLFLSACSPSSTPAPLSTGLSGATSGKVDVGGYELYYTCIGDGSPTVILEAGSEGDSSGWELVMVYYRKYTRVCAYDRANLGKSDRAKKPRTFADMTRDLHALLQNAPIEGPYVLVGYSMGGMLVRLYAGQYPEDVVGVVLVDASHPDVGARMLAALPPETAGEDKSLASWREYATWMTTSTGRSKFDVEDVNNVVSMEQVRAVNSLGDLPLAVVSRSPHNPNIVGFMPPLPEAINATIMQLWQDLQADLEGLSSNSTRYTAVGSDHGVPYYEPRLVVDAIRYVVDEHRAQIGIAIMVAEEKTDAASHAPVITGITERKEWKQGTLFIYEDIAYTDPAGDAITIINHLVSGNGTPYDDIIRATATEQKQGAVFTTSVRCRHEVELAIEYQVFDMAGNTSVPQTIAFLCPASRPYIHPIMFVGIVLFFALAGLGIWLLVRYLRGKRTTVISSQ